MIYKRKPKNFVPAFEVVSCFFEFDSKILLLKRHEHKSQGGKWGAPAGKINNGESKATALVREIQEETGINVSPEELKFIKSIYVQHSFDFIYHMFSYHLSKLQQIRISSYEHAEYKWISIDDSLKLPLIDDMEECIKMFYFPTN